MLDISPALGNNDPIERLSGRHFPSKKQQRTHVLMRNVLFVEQGESKQAKANINNCVYV